MILIASSFHERLVRWEQGLSGHASRSVDAPTDSLIQAMVDIRPRMLLLDLDLPGLDGAKGVAGSNANPATRIVAITGAVSDETELALFKIGVRGCCRNDIEASSWNGSS